MPVSKDLFASIDRYGAIKPPFTFWAITLFQVRHWIILLLVVVSARRSPETVQILGHDFNWWQLALQAPALLLLFTAMQRHPDASRAIRFLWSKGRELFTLGAALNIGWAALILTEATRWRPWPERGLLALALIEAALILYFWRSAVLKELFESFPGKSSTQRGKTP